MSIDQIANMLTCIRNAYLARHKSTKIINSKMNYQIAKALMKEGYLEDVKFLKDKREINLKLKYHGKKPSLTSIQRISKPGCRIYCSAQKIPQVLNGLGITIISTPQGVLTNSEARKKNLGGEIICKVY